MTQEFSITARNHCTGVTQECLDGMTGGRCLPFVPVKPAGVQENPRDLLLRRAGPMAIEGPQHPSEARALLACQARIRRDRATMQGRKEALNGLDPVETGEAERDDGDRDRVPLDGTVENLELLPVAERKVKLRMLISTQN